MVTSFRERKLWISKLWRKQLETNLIFFPQEEWLFLFLMKKKKVLKTVVTLILKGHSIFLLMQRNSVERYKSLNAHENCYKWYLALQWFSTSNRIFLLHCIFISVCWIFISLTWLICLCNCPEMSCWTSLRFNLIMNISNVWENKWQSLENIFL